MVEILRSTFSEVFYVKTSKLTDLSIPMSILCLASFRVISCSCQMMTAHQQISSSSTGIRYQCDSGCSVINIYSSSITAFILALRNFTLRSGLNFHIFSKIYLKIISQISCRSLTKNHVTVGYRTYRHMQLLALYW